MLVCVQKRDGERINVCVCECVCECVWVCVGVKERE